MLMPKKSAHVLRHLSLARAIFIGRVNAVDLHHISQRLEDGGELHGAISATAIS
jgi:hypothetical protein